MTGKIKKTLFYAKAVLVDMIFPPACPICGKPLGYENGKRKRICENCIGKIQYIQEPRCMKCGKQIESSDVEYCYDCEQKKHNYNRGVAVYAYTDGIKQSLYRFKYQGKREYACFYGLEAAKHCKMYIDRWGIDLIIPVPMYAAKQKKRGYNQAELIALELGKNLNIPVDTGNLIRSKKTIPMKELNDIERRKNIENAFHMKANVVKYKKILLVDDIYTTGATIDKCAEVLQKHEAKEIYFLCLCIGNGF